LPHSPFGKPEKIWVLKKCSPPHRMMERAAVPPRTIKKVSGLFWAATFIFDFFGGGAFEMH
jgi:hypothetical protein